MDKVTFLESMNSWGGSVILADQSSEERINKKLRDFISHWGVPQENPNENWADPEWLYEENQSMLDEINAALPEEYHIGYMPDDPGTIVIAKQEWWESID